MQTTASPPLFVSVAAVLGRPFVPVIVPVAAILGRPFVPVSSRIWLPLPPFPLCPRRAPSLRPLLALQSFIRHFIVTFSEAFVKYR